MYVWNESVASRGAQEIGSCVVYHLKNHIPDTTKNVILYSDACGGQNRNIKMTLLLKKALEEGIKDIVNIEQKFFVTGHSYNSCDRAFALIEKEKKFTEQIFVPNDWLKVIENSKKTETAFVVTEMKRENFFSTEILQNMITNRKKTTEKNKVNWHKIRKISNVKNDPFRLINDQEDLPSPCQIVSIQKSGINSVQFAKEKLAILNDTAREIMMAQIKSRIIEASVEKQDKYLSSFSSQQKCILLLRSFIIKVFFLSATICFVFCLYHSYVNKI